MNNAISKIAQSSMALLVLMAVAIGCDEPDVDDRSDEVADEAAVEQPEVAESDEEQAADAGPTLALADFPTGEITVVGTNSCLGCGLKGTHEAAAQCGDYGHDHAFKIEYAADADGAPIDGIVGHTIHYLENDVAADLLHGEKFHGDRVQITGRLLGAAATLEVHEFGEPSEELAQAADEAVEVEAVAGDVVITGQNSCLGCELKGEHGAQAQCSDYGHTHALYIEEAHSADGQQLVGLTGRVVHYLANDKSAPLAAGEEFHGENVRVEGRLFADTSTLEVHGFSAADAR